MNSIVTLRCSSFIVVKYTPYIATLGNTPTLVGPFSEFWIFAVVCVIPLPPIKAKPLCCVIAEP